MSPSLATWNLLLRRAIDEHDWPLAEGALRRLLLVEPSSAEQLDLLAYVLLMQGRFEDCEATLERALASGSRSFWTPHKLGDARRGRHRFASAITAYEQALAWGSDSPLTVRNLLDVMVAMDPTKALIRAQQLAADRHPGWQEGACAAAASGLAPLLAEWLCDSGAADEAIRALVCHRRLSRLDLEGAKQLLRNIETPWSAPLRQRLDRFRFPDAPVQSY